MLEPTPISRPTFRAFAFTAPIRLGFTVLLGSVFTVLLGLGAGGCSTPNIVASAGREAAHLASFPPGSEPVEAEVEHGVRLRGVFIPGPDGAPNALLVLHLLASGASSSGAYTGGLVFDTTPVYSEVRETGCASLVFDWRGVGASDGERDSRHIAPDARCMWAAALARVGGDPERIVLRGTSIGSLGTAAILESGARPRAVTIVAPVLAETVVRRWTADHIAAWVAWITRPFVRQPVDVDLCAALARAPRDLLATSGDQDELLPADDRAQVRAAVEHAGGHWVELHGDHIDVGTGAKHLYPAERELLRRLVALEPTAGTVRRGERGSAGAR